MSRWMTASIADMLHKFPGVPSARKSLAMCVGVCVYVIIVYDHFTPGRVPSNLIDLCALDSWVVRNFEGVNLRQ